MTRSRFHRRPGTARDLVAAKRPAARPRPKRRAHSPSPGARRPAPAAFVDVQPARHAEQRPGSPPTDGRTSTPTDAALAPASPFTDSPARRAFERLGSAAVRAPMPTPPGPLPDPEPEPEPGSPLGLLTASRYSIPVVAGVLIAIVALASVIIFAGVSLQEAKEADPTVARVPERTPDDAVLTAADTATAPTSTTAIESETDGSPTPDPSTTTAPLDDSSPAAPKEPEPATTETATQEPPDAAPTDPASENTPPAETPPEAPAHEAAPPPADPLAPLRDWPTVIDYTIQPGDDWVILSARFNTNANAIIAYNDITDPTHLFFGDVLQIPVGFPVPVVLPPVDPHDALQEWTRIAEFTITPSTTLTALADEFLTTPAAILEYNQLDPDAPLPVGQTLQIPWGFTLSLP